MKPDTNGEYIILPDGNLEAAEGRLDQSAPVEPIVFPRVSEYAHWQERYERARLAGVPHRPTIVKLAYRMSKVMHPAWWADDHGREHYGGRLGGLVLNSDTIEFVADCITLMRATGMDAYRAHECVRFGMILRHKGLEADFSDILLPENYRAFRVLLHSGPAPFLGMKIQAGFMVEPGDTFKFPYNGNVGLPSYGRECPTLGEAIREGIVVRFEATDTMLSTGPEPSKLSVPVYPVVSPHPDVQRRYRDMRRDGQSHKFAEMLAYKAFPGLKTDSIFNEGKFSSHGGNGCHEKELWLRRDAERKGFSTNGLWYCSGLADYPNDPKAWVGGRGDVERVAREKNLNVDGYVTHRAHEVAPKPDIEIDPKLVNREVNAIMAANPGARREDVAERVRNIRTGKVDLNPLRVKDSSTTWGE